MQPHKATRSIQHDTHETLKFFLTQNDEETRKWELSKKVASGAPKIESMRRRHLSSSHPNPSEVNDITMTSSQSQLLVLL